MAAPALEIKDERTRSLEGKGAKRGMAQRYQVRGAPLVRRRAPLAVPWREEADKQKGHTTNLSDGRRQPALKVFQCSTHARE